MNNMKRQKDRTLKDELPRLVGAQYATGDQWRTNSRKNEETEPKQKQHPVVDVIGDESKPCHVGTPRTGGSRYRVLTKRGPLEKGMANHFSILGLRIP